MRRDRVYAVPLTAGDVRLRADPRGKRGGRVLVRCDVPYVKTLSSPAPSRRLDPGYCTTTTGLSIRGPRIVQATDYHADFNASESLVRQLFAGGGPARLLDRRPRRLRAVRVAKRCCFDVPDR